MNGIGWSRVLRVSAAVLASAALCVIAGQVVQVLSFPIVGTRATLEAVSQVANAVTGLLVVGAVLLGLAANEHADDTDIVDAAGVWPLVLSGVLGAALVLAAVYAIVDVFTVHIPSTGATGQPFQVGLSSGRPVLERSAVVLQRGAGGLLGAFAAWLAFARPRVVSSSAPVTDAV